MRHAGLLGGRNVRRLGPAERSCRSRPASLVGLGSDDGDRRDGLRHRLFGRFGRVAGRVGFDLDGERRVLGLRRPGHIDRAPVRAGGLGFEDFDLHRLRLREHLGRLVAQPGFGPNGGRDVLGPRLHGRLGRTSFPVGPRFGDHHGSGGGVVRLGTAAGRFRHALALVGGGLGLDDEGRGVAGLVPAGRLDRRSLALVGPGLRGGRRVLPFRLHGRRLGRGLALVSLGRGAVRALGFRLRPVLARHREVGSHGEGHGDDFRLQWAADGGGGHPLGVERCPGVARGLLGLPEHRNVRAFGAARPPLERRPAAPRRGPPHAQAAVGPAGNRIGKRAVRAVVREGLRRAGGFGGDGGLVRRLAHGGRLQGREDLAGALGVVLPVGLLDLIPAVSVRLPIEGGQRREGRGGKAEPEPLGVGHRAAQPFAEHRAPPAPVAFGLLFRGEDAHLRAVRTEPPPRLVLEERRVGSRDGRPAAPGQAGAVARHGCSCLLPERGTRRADGGWSPERRHPPRRAGAGARSLRLHIIHCSSSVSPEAGIKVLTKSRR